MSRSMELNPNNPMSLINWGFLLQRMKRYDDAFEAFEEERPDVSKKAGDLLLLLSHKGGAPSRKAIAESNTLETAAKMMADKPNEEPVQMRGCQLVIEMGADEIKAVQDCGILEYVSKVLENFDAAESANGSIRAAAQKALDVCGAE